MPGGKLSNQDKPKQSKVVRKRKSRHSSTGSEPLSRVAGTSRRRAQYPGLLIFTLQLIYKKLYVLGIYFLRRKRSYLRRAARFFLRLRGGFYAGLDVLLKFIRNIWKDFVARLKQPFTRIGNEVFRQRKALQAAQKAGKTTILPYLRIAAEVGRLLWRIIATIFNHLAPIVAVWLLVSTVNLYLRQPLGLEVTYNGERIGYIVNETEFEKAAQILRERFVGSDAAGAVVEAPSFKLVGVSEEEEDAAPQSRLLTWANQFMRLEKVRQGYTKASELANEMVRASGDEIEWAYGFYVDNEFYGAVVDQNTLLQELETIREDNRVGKPEERVEFVKKISLTPGLYPAQSIVPIQEMYDVIHREEATDQFYEVQDEDTPTGIAVKTGVPYARIKEMNPDIEESLLVGDQVKVSVALPFLSIKNIYTSVYQEEYSYETETIETATFDRNYREVTREGEAGLREVKAEITTINGLETGRAIIGNPRLIREAVTEKIIVGTDEPKRPAVSGGTGGYAGGDTSPSGSAPSASGFLWPTAGGYATTYRNHSGNGVDIARPAGTPIYAAASGTVVLVKSGYTGYGMHVRVEHGDGFSTLYAHMSAFNVSAGQQVSQGQVIGYVGATGWAYGNHVHFEIIHNGRYQYPVNYIGSRG